MTANISSINTASDKFGVLFNRVNEIIDALNDEALTANTDANGSTTSGNSFLSGVFSASVLAASTLRGGNVQSSGNLTVTSNVTLQHNVVVTGTRLQVGNVVVTNDSAIGSKSTANLDGTSAAEVDSFAFSEILGQEYVVQVKNRNNNADTQLTKALVLHNQANAFYSEFGQVYSNVSIATVSANANSTHVRLYISPSVANVSLSITATPVRA